MFPHIHTEDRNIRRIDRVLVLGSDDLKSSLGTTLAHQPSPATSLKTEELGAKRLDECFMRPPAGGDGFL